MSSSDSEHVIGFMGVEGANADLACRQNYPYMQTMAFASFEDLFEGVAKGLAQYAMIPIENSQAGRVAEIHNLLPRTNLHIVAEHIQPVSHHLFGVSGAKLADVNQVYSHHQGLLQCRSFIHEHQLQTHIHDNTATAARDVASIKDNTKAAICSELAGSLYGLEKLASDIHDADDNATLFVAMAKEPVEIEAEFSEPVLTSLLFTLRNIPAALYKALGGFATGGINMLKLESYIQAGTQNAAQFFMTFEGDPSMRNVQLALEELGFYTHKVTVLGVYPADAQRYQDGAS
jgi:prephenate dehydratase